MDAMYPASLILDSDWFIPESKGSLWTKEENKKFERALAVYDDKIPDRWVQVAAMIPGKSVWDVIRHYEELEDDVNSIEAGLVPVPGYFSTPFPLESGDNGRFETSRKKSFAARPHEHERKKGVPWTEDEHRRFLLGLQKYGKGDWRNISRNFVISKTPTQVASHAQKYFLRLSGAKDKRRPSIHDITTASLIDTVQLGNTPHPLPDQSATQLQQNSCITSKMLLNWTSPNSEPVMVFNSMQSDLLKLSQIELQEKLYSHANHGAYLHEVCG
ncbi:hypothetical protein Dimus_033679 [Dionaea muscipula]